MAFVNPLTRPVLQYVDAHRRGFELVQRLPDQRARAMFAARGDRRAAKQDHRGGKVFGRGDDRAGIMTVERADERVEPRLNLVHLRQHHSVPRPWKSSIARSEERRVRKGWCSKCKTRWAPYNYTNN